MEIYPLYFFPPTSNKNLISFVNFAGGGALAFTTTITPNNSIFLPLHCAVLRPFTKFSWHPDKPGVFYSARAHTLESGSGMAFSLSPSSGSMNYDSESRFSLHNPGIGDRRRVSRRKLKARGVQRTSSSCTPCFNLGSFPSTSSPSFGSTIPAPPPFPASSSPSSSDPIIDIVCNANSTASLYFH